MALDFNEVKRTLESLNATQGAGRTFYVCPSSDSWSSDLTGLLKVPGQVVSTLAQAVSGCESGRGDTIVVLPGTYTGSTITVSKANLRIMGLPGMARDTVFTTGAMAGGNNVHTFRITSNDILLENLSFSNGSNDGGTPDAACLHLTAAHGMTVKNCHFTYVTEGSAQYGIWLTRTTNLTIEGCRFDNTITGGSCVYLDLTATDLRNISVVDCHFTGISKDADSNFAVGGTTSHANDCLGLLIKGNVFDPTGTGAAYGNEEWFVLDNDTGEYQGMICGNYFGAADITKANQVGDLDATLHFIGNYGLAGLSSQVPS